LATTVVVVTGERPRSPDVSASRKPPTKPMIRMIQMYFAALRICCSTGRYSLAESSGVQRYDRA
jgi:hypothetical protein